MSTRVTFLNVYYHTREGNQNGAVCNMVDHGFDPWLGQIQNYKFGITTCP